MPPGANSQSKSTESLPSSLRNLHCEEEWLTSEELPWARPQVSEHTPQEPVVG